MGICRLRRGQDERVRNQKKNVHQCSKFICVSSLFACLSLYFSFFCLFSFKKKPLQFLKWCLLLSPRYDDRKMTKMKPTKRRRILAIINIHRHFFSTTPKVKNLLLPKLLRLQRVWEWRKRRNAYYFLRIVSNVLFVSLLCQGGCTRDGSHVGIRYRYWRGHWVIVLFLYFTLSQWNKQKNKFNRLFLSSIKNISSWSNSMYKCFFVCPRANAHPPWIHVVVRRL